MDQPDGPDIGRGRDEEFWRNFLTGGHGREHALRGFLKLLPSDPRCVMCAAPFAGAGAPLMRAIGKRRSDRNPNVCTSCFAFLTANRGGAEIECTLLFADIRGSTGLAESQSPAEFRSLLDRFYDTASSAVFDYDGMVDKFVGDELVAAFYPLLSGERHAARAVEAAESLLRATGHASPDGPWVSVGAGVHTGLAWVGTIGTGARVELTAVGDAVNVTARLAAAADAGEILITDAAAMAAKLDARLPREQLMLRGKDQPTEVVRLHVP